MMEDIFLTRIHGADSWRVNTEDMEAFVTRNGGHLGPVRFRLNKRWFSPYSLAPWTADSSQAGDVPILANLRGDFFCLPFGEGDVVPTHGSPPNATWQINDVAAGKLSAFLKDETTGACIQKIIRLSKSSIYQEHKVTGLEGEFPCGYHAILHLNPENGPYRISSSPFQRGQVKPTPFTNPDAGETALLQTGAVFQSFQEIPMVDGRLLDFSRYPDNCPVGEGLFQTWARSIRIGWTAVQGPQWTWICFKDCQTLPGTAFWVSNGGRSSAPWGGQHRHRLGIEDVCAWYNNGIQASRSRTHDPDPLPCVHTFRKDQASSFRTIHHMTTLPKGFGKLENIQFLQGDRAVLKDDRGQKHEIELEHRFLSQPSP